MPVEAQRSTLARQLTIAIATPVVMLVVLGAILGRQVLQMSEDAGWVDHTDEVISTSNETSRQIVEQESAIRGYLLTEDARYLEPFTRVRPLDGFVRMEALVTDNPQQQARIAEARRRYEGWLSVSVRLMQGGDLAAAKSKASMEDRRVRMEGIRDLIREGIGIEEALRKTRSETAAQSLSNTKLLFVSLLAASAVILGFFSRRQLGAVAGAFQSALLAETKSREAVETEAWIRAGQAQVAGSLQGELSIEQLGADVLEALTAYVQADVGALFTKVGGEWQRKAGFALDSNAAGPSRFAEGEGIIGRAGATGEVLHVRDLPPDFLKLRSGTGEASPNDLVVIPAAIEGFTNTVVELGFLRTPPPRTMTLLHRIGEAIALAVRSCDYKQQLRELLEEAQRQTEELQTQQEELRVANEELEAQTTTLQATQKQLETQQAELEQTNDHLSEQAKLLERQNLQLGETHAEIEVKAKEVERASQFKSEFLSNMSHELRTPLNSSLILAKLLADNKDGNLSAEQVKFAETIYAAGNDLLTLINDILDLSKIESGKMDVHPGVMPLERLRTGMLRMFDPIANQKSLRFTVKLSPGLPQSMETDAQRLEQIVKNLLSNALKFTERGEVALQIAAAGDGSDRVVFTVRDTGIGIPAGQIGIIFEAFRQADGTTNRKFGGTGLGLSISRELARLLGGDIVVVSEAGKGSTFTLTLPRIYSGPAAAPETPRPVPVRPAPLPTPSKNEGPSGMAEQDDGSAALEPGKRIVLMIEDDAAFARILVDVAREAGFQCLVSTTALDGFRLAKKHGPTGIVLDMNLPDHTGLSVLDRLKRDPSTRHIPVHVISASDYVETALSMGAAAYLLKPVAREQLVAAFHAIEERSSHQVRHVLVVDDDADLRESVAKLLGRSGVEIRTVATVEAALKLLREETFDCVVTDLGLPGQSGYDLLESMAQEELPYSVPPVIVYTGRALTSEEEQRLRKFSSSIIVKGARSPERLLDEVTLFLHQVESELPVDQQRLLKQARHREAIFEGRSVLVVEDDVRNVYALTSVLEPKGMRVVIARNGKEGLAALARDPAIDLVLMDLMMPEMDGLEATREIRKNPKWGKLPVIALTAKAMRDDQERCMAAGASDYLAKPLDIEMLLSLLRVWMPKK